MARDEFDDETPSPRPRRGGPPRRRGPDRDDDNQDDRRRPRRAARRDDDEDDRPRRKPARKKSNLPIILGVAAIGGLLLLSACGIGLYYLASPKDSPKLGTTGPTQGAAGGGAGGSVPGVAMPPGWVVWNDPSSELRLYWPKGQPNRAAGTNSETWTQEFNGRKYTLVRSPLPAAEARPGAEAATLENAVAGMLSAMAGAKEVRKNTDNEQGRLFRVSTIDLPQGQRVFARLTIGKGKLIMLTITAPQNNVFWATEPDTAPFFQSLWVK